MHTRCREAQPNLARTLTTLEAAGFITMKTVGRRRTPSVAVKKIVVEIDPYPNRPVTTPPLLIDFVSPSSLLKEEDRVSTFPIVGNGPPGTFVLFPNGLRVSLPTDQIVFADDADGHARVGFGGMRFMGVEDRQLMFTRVRELFLEDQLSPARSHKMLLDTQWVAAITVDGHPAWPAGRLSP